MNMKKRITVLLAAAVSLSLTACGGQGTQTIPDAEGTVHEAESQTGQESELFEETVQEETVQEEAEAAKKDTLIVRIARDAGDLNPHTMKSQMAAQDWVYESLVALE